MYVSLSVRGELRGGLIRFYVFPYQFRRAGEKCKMRVINFISFSTRMRPTAKLSQLMIEGWDTARL
jgi:hypothetical protein